MSGNGSTEGESRRPRRDEDLVVIKLFGEARRGEARRGEARRGEARRGFTWTHPAQIKMDS
ncbi:hypothetical protein CRUP_018113 [Coryphaenoides rupestris]|nr:hypothetical protein CRUP_018113 [Coryphaenoides rupestris]